jgi:hypothetical protein
MRRWLVRTALLFAVATLATWLATGAHRGFTQTSVAVEKTDEVTGLTYREYQPRFVAGVEVLGLGLGAALALFGVSRLCRA